MASSIIAEACRFRYMSHAEMTLKNSIIESVFNRPIALFRKKDNAYYVNLLTTDIEMYRNDGLRPIPNIVSSFVSLAAALAMLYFIHPMLFWGSILLAGVPLSLNNIFTGVTQKRKDILSEKNERFMGVLKEIVEGNDAIRENVSKKQFEIQFSTANRMHQEAYVKSGLTNTISTEFFFGVARLMQIFCYGIGGYLIVKQKMPVAMMFAAVNYYVAVANHLCNIVAYGIQIRSVKNVKQKLLAESRMNADNSENDPPEKYHITFENVTFGFGDRKLYENFSCSIEEGSCCMLAGESGSGKTTLTKLLLKYYEEYSGVIRIGNTDVKNLSEDEIYEIVGVVSQTPFIFDKSLYENITMLKGTNCAEDRVYQTLLSEINLQKLAERVGNNSLGDFGDNISGGERQRINLARALYKNPQILIFDEPTTGLDPENVKLINEYIFKRKDLTRIVISHDWSEEYRIQFDRIIEI